ncbi:MAG TPA: hypothetical protein DCY91_26780 [Cyanobacteria bacterium UBA11370]|nr:hypothetical protein [Cyanobacteria bacterium UBA11370]HBY76861.1 hypothetical protein [Cyanobacteria bacterium UBA11148]
MNKNNRIERIEAPLNSRNPEALERQLRKITVNLEQLKLNPAQQERLISLTFLDILRELSHNQTESNTPTLE